MLRGSGVFHALGAMTAIPPGKGCRSQDPAASRFGGSDGRRRGRRCRGFPVYLRVEGCGMAREWVK
jgi:hypothetical protein